MMCDKCKNKINENIGYVTVYKILSATLSQKINGKLVNKPCLNDQTKEIVCISCLYK